MLAAVIREATTDDARAAAALLAVISPEFVTTAAAIRHAMTTVAPGAERRWWCAERGGEILGWSSVGLVVETSEPGIAWIGVAVHPDHRGRGVGVELLDVTERHAAAIGTVRLHGWSRGDDVSTSFARAHGYLQMGTHDLLVVDPRTVAPPEPAAGIELLPFTAFENDPSPIHHVDAISVLDEPGEVTYDELPFERWLENFWNHPLLDRDASTVALVDGVPATVTFLQTDRETGRGTNNGTGTLPEYRGRGVATLAKRASLARAAELGITAVSTGNNVTNAPMQAINRKLGYAPSSTLYDWSKPLGDVTT